LGPHPKSLALARGKRIVVGQDVHKAKHVSGVHIVTESSDVVADLMARRYVLARGARTWTLDEMRRMRAAPFPQRFRTALLRAVAAAQGAGPVFIVFAKGHDLVGCLPGLVSRIGPVRIFGSPLAGWQTGTMGPVFDKDRISTDEMLSLAIPLLERRFNIHHV